MREYDDEQALMGYVWRNYPEIVRRHECVPPAERVRDELPAELREEYWQHAVECRRLIAAAREREKRLSDEARCVEINPALPTMRPELLAAVRLVRDRLEKQAFWNKFLPHKDRVSIHRCARCNRILVNDKTRQCFGCGYDWH